jgi:putative DNA primase/helicase
MTQNSTVDVRVKAGHDRFADTREFVAVLHRLAQPLSGKGRLVVASYGQDPATGKDLTPKVAQFEIGDVDGMVNRIAMLSGEQHRNVYVSLAVVRPDLKQTKKGEEGDLVAVLGLVADFDDTDAANHSARLPVDASVVLETSPSRYQSFLFFDKPIPVSKAKPLAQRLKAHARCDHGTADCSHVWRVPGILNWPNRKKANEGRPLEPFTARIAVPFEGLVTSPADLDAAIPAAKVVELPRVATTQIRPVSTDIEARMARSYPPGERSGPAFGVICTLVEMGCSDSDIMDKAAKYPNGFGNRYIDHEKLLTGDIKRARDKATGRFGDHSVSAIVSPIQPRARSDGSRQQSDAPTSGGGQDSKAGKDSDGGQSSGHGPLSVGTAKHGIVPLGHDRGKYYYLSRGSRQVVGLTASQHTKLELMALASVPYFWERTPFKNDKGGVSWDQAADHLMQSCQQVGIYNPDKIRGRGAWLDKGRAVLHLGDRLIVDGMEHDLLLAGSTHVYEGAVPLSQALEDPISATEAKKILDIFSDFEWERPIDGRLLAGWCAVAAICGALTWRPSIWLTGPSGSGKTTLTSVIALLLGGMALNVQSKTSEAGIRQTLGSDARPVLFDEAEAEDLHSKHRMQGVFDLVRQSSSEGGAEIVKGTASQTGAKRYRIRSCFAFSSINVSLENFADENRITVLSLSSPPDRDDPEAQAMRAAHWEQLNRKITDTLTPNWCAGLIARSVKLAAVIRQNAETFAAAVAKRFGNRRLGDQIGTLLAGAYSLESDGLVTQEAAEKWIERNAASWDAIDADVETDEQRLLTMLMQVLVRISGNGSTIERTIGELVNAARNRERQVDEDDGCGAMISQDVAQSELKRHGIRYEIEETLTNGVYQVREGIWIANKHSALSRFLANTPWSAQWARSLIRLKYAQKSEKVMKFSHGVVQRAIWLPISVVLPDGE